jgi:hypothetical protein
MEYHELKNYGNLFSGKAPPQEVMKTVAKVPAHLGILGTPKFMANMQRQERHWKRKQFTSIEERGIQNQEFIDVIRNSLGFSTALSATCGKQKSADIHQRISLDLGYSMWKRHWPKDKDFLNCSDPWNALEQYVLGFVEAWERASIAEVEVLTDTDGEFRLHLTDCAFAAAYREAGHPEVGALGEQVESRFLGRLTKKLGGEFRRESCLCHGDATCDWHLLRNRAMTPD